MVVEGRQDYSLTLILVIIYNVVNNNQIWEVMNK